ncbi:MAG: HPr family phosphocarrier protein [Planctomycetes bacterium]|nr:HPr family phosphocarrier protein [Planctomycetota bacterium]
MKRTVTISNRAGLHARPISKFVEIANRFQADLKVFCNGQTVNGKSIIQLMTLAAAMGTELELISEGVDSQALLDSLEVLVLEGFEEKMPPQ